MRTSRLMLATLGAAAVSVTAAAIGERRLLRRMASTVAPEGWVTPRFPDGTEVMVPTDDGAELRVVVAGPPDGRAVVLVHGLTSSHDDWGPVAASLLAEGYRVVGINQRGHGASTIGTEGFGAKRLGADVGQVLSALDLHDVTLVGHSMGGVAAMSLMVLAPDTGAERVGRLVLVATLADATRSDRRTALRLADRQKTSVSSHPVHGRAITRLAFGLTPSSAMVDDALASLARCPDATRIGASLGLVAYDIREALGSIDRPTRVICGTRDVLTPLSENRRIAAAIPGAELVVVPGAGHLVIWEAPDVIVGAVRELDPAVSAVDAT